MTHLFTFVLGIFNMVFRGFLIKTFWAWFVMTQFASLPALSVVGAIGLSCFVSIMTPWRGFTATELEERRDDSGAVALVNGGVYFLAMMIAWGVGYVIHTMM